MSYIVKASDGRFICDYEGAGLFDEFATICATIGQAQELQETMIVNLMENINHHLWFIGRIYNQEIYAAKEMGLLDYQKTRLKDYVLELVAVFESEIVEV